MEPSQISSMYIVFLLLGDSKDDHQNNRSLLAVMMLMDKEGNDDDEEMELISQQHGKIPWELDTPSRDGIHRQQCGEATSSSPPFASSHKCEIFNVHLMCLCHISQM